MTMLNFSTQGETCDDRRRVHVSQPRQSVMTCTNRYQRDENLFLFRRKLNLSHRACGGHSNVLNANRVNLQHLSFLFQPQLVVSKRLFFTLNSCLVHRYTGESESYRGPEENNTFTSSRSSSESLSPA